MSTGILTMKSTKRQPFFMKNVPKLLVIELKRLKALQTKTNLRRLRTGTGNKLSCTYLLQLQRPQKKSKAKS